MSKELDALEFICKILDEKSIDVKWLFKEQYNTIKQALIKAQEQEKFIDIIKRKGMFISAKELKTIETYEDYKGIISERKLQQELMLHIIPTLIDWNNLENTMFYTEEEFNIVKEMVR